MRASRTMGLLLAMSLAGMPFGSRAQEGAKGSAGSGPALPTQAPAMSPSSQLHPRGTVYLMEQAPDFELDASTGQAFKLSSLRGNKVLLVFQPYREHLAALKRYLPTLWRDEIVLVGVCHDKQGSLMHLAKRDSVGFIMLADVTGQVSMMYGLYDNATRTIEPGLFLLDARGVVRFLALGPVSSMADLISVAASVLPGP